MFIINFIDYGAWKAVVKEKRLNACQTRTAGFLSVQMASNAEKGARECCNKR